MTHRSRKAVTVAVAGAITLGLLVATLVPTTAHPTTAADWVAGSVGYLTGAAGLGALRGPFRRLNRRAAPSRSWWLVGVLPVALAPSVPLDRWPGRLLFGVVLGLLLGAALIKEEPPRAAPPGSRGQL